jgi:hypothetical protein
MALVSAPNLSLEIVLEPLGSDIAQEVSEFSIDKNLRESCPRCTTESPRESNSDHKQDSS